MGGMIHVCRPYRGCAAGAIPVSYTHLDVYKRQEGDFTAIEGATEQFFAVSVDYLGKYIRFEVTPRADSDPKDGEPVQSEAVKVENLSRLFVATNGDNTNAGTIDSPLKTIEGARDKICLLYTSRQIGDGNRF